MFEPDGSTSSVFELVVVPVVGCAHRVGESSRARYVGRLVTGDDAQPVCITTVLTELPLAIEVRDFDFQADDGPQLPINELAGSIGHLPCGGVVGALRLVSVGQIGHELANPVGVVVDACDAVRVHDLVVPRRNDLRVLDLRRIPGRGRVAIGQWNEHEHVQTVEELPLIIRTSEVALERTEGATRPVEQQR
jgi:hypothetical protein